MSKGADFFKKISPAYWAFDKLTKAKPVSPGASQAASPQVESPASDSDKTAQRIGRAALLSTSPQGVLTTEPTGRRKVLGN